MKNVLTVSDLVDVKDGTTCPFALHKKIKEREWTPNVDFAAVESGDAEYPEQHGTILHAIIQHKLTCKADTHKYIHPKIAGEAADYIAWAKTNGLLANNAKCEQTIVTTLNDEYMPAARLVGRPDLVTRNRAGKLTVVDWKIPNAKIVENYKMEIKFYAVQVMLQNNRFEDCNLIIYNGKPFLMQLTAAEMQHVYNKLTDICTAAVADTAPEKPTPQCGKCKQLCDSMYYWAVDYIGIHRGEGVKLSPYIPLIKAAMSEIVETAQTAIADGIVSGASAPSGKAYQSCDAAVEEYEAHCLKTGNKPKTKITKTVNAASFAEECGEEAAEKYKTKLSGQYTYPSLL